VEIKNRQQTLLIVALVVLGLFAANVWSARARKIDELRKRVAEGKMLLDRDAEIRGRWGRMERSTLPNNTSAAEQQFFRALYDWQQSSGVTINATTPQWKHDADNYMTYQCRVDAAGNISMLSRFLYEIEKSPIAVKLESVELAARDKEGQQLALGLQISGLVLTPPTK
jgi:Tfp pilus assembly protein PilO